MVVQETRREDEPEEAELVETTVSSAEVRHEQFAFQKILQEWEEKTIEEPPAEATTSEDQTPKDDTIPKETNEIKETEGVKETEAGKETEKVKETDEVDPSFSITDCLRHKSRLIKFYISYLSEYRAIGTSWVPSPSR